MKTRYLEAGLLVLFVAVLIDKVLTDTSCSISSPQCYKSTTNHDEDYTCKWKDPDYSTDAIYSIFIQKSFVNDSFDSNQFNDGINLFTILPVEQLSTAQTVDIWVHRQVFHMTCNSPAISVRLKDSVKYSSPIIQKKIRSAEWLTLSWPRVNDNKGAIHEIRWKKINDSWQNTSFETEARINNGLYLDSYTLQLQKYQVYQVQIRRKAIQSLLWSDWSQTTDIPTEIQKPFVHWKEKINAARRYITLTWNIPPPEASFGGVLYNLSLNIPCYRTINETISKNTFKIVATYSEVKVFIVAINNVGSSPIQEIIIPPVKHLKYCHNDSHRNLPQKGKRYCLEWYKLEDGETRPEKVNISWIRWKNHTLQDMKKGMNKSERYYYYLHTGQNQQRHTSIRCPVYAGEDVPTSQPKNIMVLNITRDSAMLWWQSIPVQEQHGFLIDYVIRISKDGDTNIGYYEVPANQSSFLLSNLKPGFSYTLSIAGRTKFGEGPNSNRSFFTLGLLTNDNGLKMVEVISIVCGIVLLFSVALSIAIRRLKSKLLPIIPSPVISPVAMPHMDHQNSKPLSEVLDEVILLRLDDQDKLAFHFPKQILTSLHDCKVRVEEEEEEDEKEEEEDESPFIGFISSDILSSFPNPNYKGKLFQFTESLEMSDRGQMENCEVNLSLYRNGLFFEN